MWICMYHNLSNVNVTMWLTHYNLTTWRISFLNFMSVLWENFVVFVFGEPFRPAWSSRICSWPEAKKILICDMFIFSYFSSEKWLKIVRLCLNIWPRHCPRHRHCHSEMFLTKWKLEEVPIVLNGIVFGLGRIFCMYWWLICKCSIHEIEANN